MTAFRCRLAEALDYAVLADFRWRLQTDDASWTDADREDFMQRYEAVDRARTTKTQHWIVEQDGVPVGAMSVLVIDRIPAPGQLAGQWGCVTNAYLLPEHRNNGAGSALLHVIKERAMEDGLELLLVWPSDKAYPFYERAGFASGRDPLVLTLNPDP